MPVYEYACEKCGRTTEAIRRMSEADDPMTCEHCGSRKTKRAHSLFAAAASSRSGSDVSLPQGGCCRCGDPNGPCNMM